jgi:hypothetical protein
MGTLETIQFGAKEYKLPGPLDRARVPRELATFACKHSGYRVMALEGKDAILEPPQDGVLNYPAVQVRTKLILNASVVSVAA